jgi:hypothetical protein
MSGYRPFWFLNPVAAANRRALGLFALPKAQMRSKSKARRPRSATRRTAVQEIRVVTALN